MEVPYSFIYVSTKFLSSINPSNFKSISIHQDICFYHRKAWPFNVPGRLTNYLSKINFPVLKLTLRKRMTIQNLNIL